jgi:hypothetical protein
MPRKEILIWEKIRVLGYITFILVAILLPIKAYYEAPYIIDRDVSVHLDYAAKLTDAKAIGYELEIALKNLEPYHGNPCWFFPTVKTDIDYIKTMIKSQLDMARSVEKLPSSDYAYQRYIENCVRTLPELKRNIDDYAFWLFVNPWNTFFAFLWVILLIIYMYVDIVVMW